MRDRVTRLQKPIEIRREDYDRLISKHRLGMLGLYLSVVLMVSFFSFVLSTAFDTSGWTFLFRLGVSIAIGFGLPTLIIGGLAIYLVHDDRQLLSIGKTINRDRRFIYLYYGDKITYYRKEYYMKDLVAHGENGNQYVLNFGIGVFTFPKSGNSRVIKEVRKGFPNREISKLISKWEIHDSYVTAKWLRKLMDITPRPGEEIPETIIPVMDKFMHPISNQRILGREVVELSDVASMEIVQDVVTTKHFTFPDKGYYFCYTTETGDQGRIFMGFIPFSDKEIRSLEKVVMGAAKSQKKKR